MPTSRKPTSRNHNSSDAVLKFLNVGTSDVMESSHYSHNRNNASTVGLNYPQATLDKQLAEDFGGLAKPTLKTSWQTMPVAESVTTPLPSII